MKNILLVHNSADLYGASQSLIRLCKTVDRLRFYPSVVLPEDGPLRTSLEALEVKVTIIPTLRVITRTVIRSKAIIPWLGGFLPAAARLAAHIRRNNISLVHTNTGVICSSALAARMANVPHIWHIRDWFQEFGPLWAPYSRYILNFSDVVFCVSSVIANQFAISKKTRVLNNGFDLTDFPSIKANERIAGRQQWGFGNDDFVVGNVGRIKFHRKGQETLLAAVAILRASGIPARALLIGDSPPGSSDQLPRMKALAAQLGLESAAVFAGELRDPRIGYAAMDTFVLPSAQPEPFGGVVMEAMAYEIPVVGTALGGTTEQILDRETGFLVPPADPDLMADRLTILASSKDRRVAMGKTARSRMALHFDLKKMTSTIEDAYTSLTRGT